MRRAVGVTILVVAALLRFWALRSGLPHLLTRPDEELVLYATEPLARGAAAPEWEIYPHAYTYLTWAWGSAGLRGAARLGILPHRGYLATLVEQPAELIGIGRILSAVASVAAVALLLALCRPLGADGALCAMAIVAVNPLSVRDAHAMKPDALLTLATVGTLVLLARVGSRPSWSRLAALGIAVGLGIGMKYPAVLLLVPIATVLVDSQGARGMRDLLVVSAVVALTFAMTNPLLLVSGQARSSVAAVLGLLFPKFFAQLAQPLPPVLATIAPPRPLGSGFVYHATFSLRYGLGIAFAIATPLLVVRGLLSRRPLTRAAAVFSIVWYLVNSLSPASLSRYMSPLVPAIAVLAGDVVSSLTARYQRGLAAVLVGLALVEPLGAAIAHDRIAAARDTRLLAYDWLTSHARAGARIAIIGTRLWGYGEPLLPPGMQAERLRPDVRSLPDPPPDLVVTHEHPTFASFVPPDQWAALEPKLELVAEFDPFTVRRNEAVFEYLDAYYIPVHGFSGVTRPGPVIRIWRPKVSS